MSDGQSTFLALPLQVLIGDHLDLHLGSHVLPPAVSCHLVREGLFVEDNRELDRLQVAQSVEGDASEPESSPEAGLGDEFSGDGADVGSTPVDTAASA